MREERGSQGSFKEFYHILSFLITGLNRFFAQRAIISFFYEGLKLVPVYLVKIIIDDVFTGPTLVKEASWVGWILLIYLVLIGIEMFAIWHTGIAVIEFQRSFLERIHKKLLHLPLSFHESQRPGGLVAKLNKASHYISDFVYFAGTEIIPTILQIILTSGVLMYTAWKIGFVYLGSIPLILWMIGSTREKTQPYREVYHKKYDTAIAELSQSLYNIKTVKDYAQENKEHRGYASLLKDYVEMFKVRMGFEISRIVWRDAFTVLIRLSTMLLAIYMVIKGELTPGDLVLVFTLTEKAFLNLYRLGRVYDILGDAHESLSQAKGVLEEHNPLLEVSEPLELSKLGSVEFSKVRFSYSSEVVLREVNFVIPAKKTVALIGASGSGKSTIIKLLTRHYDPTSGAILLDGVDLRKFLLNALRKKIAVVSQHTEMFNRSIHDNIAYAKPRASQKEVITAAKRANAHRFIQSFKEGYNTIVGEKGVRLSGGQQQRLSIARALLAEPEILIFDEATSSLDSESELSIQKAIFSVRGKYTMIIIAHRLSTIEQADLVVVLDKGRVAEVGTHKELLRNKKGLYRKMRQLQRLGELRK